MAKRIIVVDTDITANLVIKLAIENPDKEIIYYQMDNPETSAEIYYTLYDFEKLFPNIKRVSLNLEPYLEPKKDVEFIVVGDIGMGNTWDLLKEKGYKIINGSSIEELEIYRSKFKQIYKDKKLDVLPRTWKCKNIQKAIDIVNKEIDDDSGFVFKIDGIIRDDTFHTRLFKNKFFGLEWLESVKDYDVECMIEEYVNGQEFAITGYCSKNGFIDYVVLNIEDKQAISDCEELLVGQSASLDWIVSKYNKQGEKIKFYKEVLEPIEDYLVSKNYIGYFDVNCIYDYENDKIYILEATCGRFGSPSQNIFECLLNIEWTDFFNKLIDGDKFNDDDFVMYNINSGNGLYALSLCINQEDYHSKPKSANKIIYGYEKKDILNRAYLIKDIKLKENQIYYTPFDMWYDKKIKKFRCVEDAGRVIVATMLTSDRHFGNASLRLRKEIYNKIYIPNMFVKKFITFSMSSDELNSKIHNLIN